MRPSNGFLYVVLGRWFYESAYGMLELGTRSMNGKRLAYKTMCCRITKSKERNIREEFYEL